MGIIIWRHTLKMARHDIGWSVEKCCYLVSAHTTNSLAPPYLSDDCQLVTDVGRRHLRSADVHTCTVPRTQSRLGDRSFGVAGPRLWNSLPVELRQQDICLTEFRRLLKTVLFRWDSAHCDFFVLMAPGISTLTYLLTAPAQHPLPHMRIPLQYKLLHGCATVDTQYEVFSHTIHPKCLRSIYRVGQKK